MEFVKINIVFGMFLLISSMLAAKDIVCNPDQSIAYQKTKTISHDAKILLAKVIKDSMSVAWPVEVCKCWISSLYGPRKSGFHNGVDFAAVQGTPVYASADGFVDKVEMSKDKNGYGNMILLDHAPNNYKTRYAHLHEVFVQVGQVVVQGQQIGTVGSTGHVISKTAQSDPSHLHFELYRGSTRINPLLALFAVDTNWVQNQV